MHMSGETRVKAKLAMSVRRRPNFRISISLEYVKLGYCYLVTHLLKLALIPLTAMLFVEATRTDPNDLLQVWLLLKYNLLAVFTLSGLLVVGCIFHFFTRPRPVYLVDYTCYKPPVFLETGFEEFLSHSKLIGFNNSSLEFQRKILERSGLSEHTHVSEAVKCVPPRPTMLNARTEAEQVMFGALDNLFAATGVKPKDIDILIVNCSLFSPTPSLSAMIINKYKLRSNIKSYNLSGMGCSASVISINLANDLLQVHRNSYAIVVSTENITQNWYFGNRKSMLIPNCLFRVGGAAILLSNWRSDRCHPRGLQQGLSMCVSGAG
ncbi:3-ketoacyl-CoA synthase [Rhynchospora pubera]|uniref:3-ketoacyl-CoA synthase n=1 Tax=Rhynchospora pubera TaxID=906938 RepID=A0AAV8HZL3_9POAL|nr:3-ketoacyl-CoA synthase [Rhynchospora pubera]